MTSTGLRGLQQVVITILLVAVGVAITLLVISYIYGMISPPELQVKEHSSYIYTLGGKAYMVLELQNNDGRLVIREITIETDEGPRTIYNISSPDQASSDFVVDARSSKTIEKPIEWPGSGDTAGLFGQKDRYKIVIKYWRPDGSTGVAQGYLYFKG